MSGEIILALVCVFVLIFIIMKNTIGHIRCSMCKHHYVRWDEFGQEATETVECSLGLKELDSCGKWEQK
jgi:hypothetical protein